jgi:hypothetical protein
MMTLSVQHEQAADDRQDDLVLGGHGDGAQRAAQRQRAGVAHEDLGRRRVVPEEAQAGADQGPAEHRQLANARHVVDLQVFGEDVVADEIGDQAKRRRRDHHRHDGQAVETVGEVHRVGEADDHQRGEGQVEPAQVQQQVLEDREGHRGRQLRRLRRLAAEPDQQGRPRGEGDGELDDQLHRSAETPAVVCLVTLS